MFRRFVAVVLGLSLFGQGCTLPSGALSPAQEPPLGEPSPEGFVPFRDGFGFLPGAPRTVIPPAHRYTLVLQAAIPEVPSNVTILRARNAAPNDTLLRNVTTAVHVPAGALGRHPVGQNLTVHWDDSEGYHWTYNALNQTVSFRATTSHHPTATQTKPETTEEAIEWAKSASVHFLDAHGANRNGWGLETDVFRSSRDASITVLFAASQDEQPVALRSGAPDRAASVTADPQTGAVVSGWFVVPTLFDRSNYTALTNAELLERLRAGGTNPPASDAVITLTNMSFALYRDEVTLHDQPRTFYIPALWARGTSRIGDRITSYATIVPLVTDSAFVGKD